MWPVAFACELLIVLWINESTNSNEIGIELVTVILATCTPVANEVFYEQNLIYWFIRLRNDSCSYGTFHVKCTNGVCDQILKKIINILYRIVLVQLDRFSYILMPLLSKWHDKKIQLFSPVPKNVNGGQNSLLPRAAFALCCRSGRWTIFLF